MGVRFTNPWWVVVGAVTGLFVCNGPVLGFTFGVFLKPIMTDMGWQRGTASFALSFGGIFSALAVPVIGHMMDRWSIRRVARRKAGELSHCSGGMLLAFSGSRLAYPQRHGRKRDCEG